MIRLALGNYLLSLGRALGQSDAGELVVDVTDHRLLVRMEEPNTDRRAWDPDLFVSGQMYLEGYANPVKPTVDRNEDMEKMDEAAIETTEGPTTVTGDELISASDDGGGSSEAVADGGEVADPDHVKLLSSWRYKEYQDQHLITELVRPQEQWKMIIYILLGIGGLIAITLFVSLWGTFG